MHLLRQFLCEHSWASAGFGTFISRLGPLVIYRCPAEKFACIRCDRTTMFVSRRSVINEIGEDPNDPFWSGDYDAPGSIGPADPGKIATGGPPHRQAPRNGRFSHLFA